MKFLYYQRKYKVFSKQVLQDKISSFDLELVDLSDKKTKIFKIYYLFYYYLRIIYRNISIILALKNAKAIRLKKNIFFLFRSSQFIVDKDKSKRNKYNIKKIKFNFFKKIKSYSKYAFDYLIYLLKSKSLFLSKYLEHLSSYTFLRNISKLSIFLKKILSKLHYLNIYKLMSLLRKFKKYIWHYKRIIINKIQFRKFNYFIQFILLISSVKYSIFNYLFFNHINKKNINYITWFISLLTSNIRNLFSLFPLDSLKNIILRTILIMRYLYNNIQIQNKKLNIFQQIETYFFNLNVLV